jgi:hypothetical protein
MSIGQDLLRCSLRPICWRQSESFPLVRCVIGPRKNGSAAVGLRWVERGVEQQAAPANKFRDKYDLRVVGKNEESIRRA